MHSWKKKLVVSQLALACTLAIASQANAADISNSTYNTFGYDSVTNHNGALYDGYVDWHNSSSDNSYYGDVYPVIKNATVNGVLSTYYLDDGAKGNANSLSITNSKINGMITSQCMTTTCEDDKDHQQYQRFQLTVDNSTINDTYEHYYYNVVDGDKTTMKSYDTYGLGNAITLDTESDIVIQNNSKIAGITLLQGYQQKDNTPYDGIDGIANNSEIFTNTLTVKDSVLTSGAYSELDNSGFYGQSAKPSDYSNIAIGAEHSWDDAALIVAASKADNAMQTTATFDHSTITGDILFYSSFDNNFYKNGDPATDTTNDGIYNPTTNGWDDTDKLTVTVTNGSKWVGAAVANVDYTDKLYGWGYNSTDWRALLANSIWPESTFDSNGHLNGTNVYQSGIFNVALDNGSEWDTRKASRIDDLTVNNHSQVNVENSSLLADSITLTKTSSLNLGNSGTVSTNNLYLDSYSTATLAEETSELYANTITVDNGAQLNLGLGQVDTHNMVLTDAGVLNVGSREYVLNSDLNNARYITNDKTRADYDYGIVAINSDGHLAVNGDVAGNYKVRIDDAKGTGSVKDYKNKEVIRIYDNNADTKASFTRANKADLGAYRYQAEQKGDTVVMRQMELTDYANMALSIPSANTNIWNLQQDTLSTRLTNGRHGLADNGGAWVSYFGGNLNGDNGVINYDQDVSGIMVGVDTFVDGNNAKWIVGAAAGFAKGDVSDRSGKVDQDSQSAYIYSSARFTNNIFLDGNLSYSRFDNDLSASMSNGQYVDGDSSTDAWGFGLKLGYDWKVNDKGYVTPYAGISGLFQSGDNFRLSNNMKAGDQDYDSLRYELGVNTGYTFTYGSDQALTPYFNLAYVYDDSNNTAKVNGDSIDNGVEGSAVRVGLGTQFSFTKNFSAYTDVNYLGGGDVEQDWGAKVGVKYTW